MTIAARSGGLAAKVAGDIGTSGLRVLIEMIQRR
jgi:hypothetical protein